MVMLVTALQSQGQCPTFCKKLLRSPSREPSKTLWRNSRPSRPSRRLKRRPKRRFTLMSFVMGVTWSQPGQAMSNILVQSCAKNRSNKSPMLSLFITTCYCCMCWACTCLFERLLAQVSRTHSRAGATSATIAVTLTCARLATKSVTGCTLDTASRLCLDTYSHSHLSSRCAVTAAAKSRSNRKIASSAWSAQTTICAPRVLGNEVSSTPSIPPGITWDSDFAADLLLRLSQSQNLDMRTGML